MERGGERKRERRKREKRKGKKEEGREGGERKREKGRGRQTDIHAEIPHGCKEISKSTKS